MSCCARVVSDETSRPIKPTSLIRDADLSLRIAGLPVLTEPDVGSSETELRRPTCPFVQVIIGPARHKRENPRRETCGDFFVPEQKGQAAGLKQKSRGAGSAPRREGRAVKELKRCAKRFSSIRRCPGPSWPRPPSGSRRRWRRPSDRRACRIPQRRRSRPCRCSS